VKRKTLITYTSRYGTSTKIAYAIAESLKNKGVDLDIHPMIEVTDLSDYSTIILGGPIYFGKWYEEVEEFLIAHQEKLKKLKVYYYVVSMTMSEDTPENRSKTIGFIQPVLDRFSDIKPLDIGLFAGSTTGLPTLMHMVFRSTDLPKGDFLNLDKAKKWGREVAIAS
jgi:menaquinone-dependent protoporphyrinogen IX oxidase